MFFKKVNKEETLFEGIDVNEIVYLKGKKGGANVEVNITFAYGGNVRTNLSYAQFEELSKKFEDASTDLIVTDFPFPNPESGQIIKVSDNSVETLLDEAIASNETSKENNTTKGGKEKGKEAKG